MRPKTKSFQLYNILRRNARMRQLLDEIQLQAALLDEARALLPMSARGHLRGLRFRHNRLRLFVDSPVWASRLRLSLPRLLQQLRKRHEAILAIDIRVDACHPPPRRARAPRRLGARAAESLATTASNIQDPALAEALRRLSRHAGKG